MKPVISIPLPPKVHPTRARILPKLLTVAAIVVPMLLVGCYYEWAVRATGTRFEWGQDLRGYYNYLGRALAAGNLHLPIEPARELLALDNPWDPIKNDPYRMHDMVLFNGRYYLYHGVGPAALVFAPWRIATGNDLPENFAVAVFCFGGFLLYSAALLRILAVDECMPGPALLTLLVFVLGVCQSLPFLCNRISVYEVPIAAGFLCIGAALFFLTIGITTRSPVPWLAASGMMFGVAISCRPHLGLAGSTCLITVIVWKYMRASEVRIKWSGIAAFLIPFLLAGAMVAAYNYARFGDAFEFGIRFLLAGDTNQQRIHLSFSNLVTGLYYFLVSPPDLSAVFPWVRLVMRHPFGGHGYAFPSGYFLEPTAGVLFIAPFLVGMFFPARRTSALAFLSSTASLAFLLVLLFVASTGFTTQRYVVDFLPLGVFAALLNFAALLQRRRGFPRVALVASFLVLAAYSMIANLAFGIAGPYGEMLANRPASYTRIAAWLSPFERFRPLLNPRVRIAISVDLQALRDGVKEPVLTLGADVFRHVLFMERRHEAIQLTLRSSLAGVAEKTATLDSNPAKLQLAFDPELRKITAHVEDQTILEQRVDTLVLAPSQIFIGGTETSGNTGERVKGRIRLLEKVISEK